MNPLTHFLSFCTPMIFLTIPIFISLIYFQFTFIVLMLHSRIVKVKKLKTFIAPINYYWFMGKVRGCMLLSMWELQFLWVTNLSIWRKKMCHWKEKWKRKREKKKRLEENKGRFLNYTRCCLLHSVVTKIKACGATRLSAPFRQKFLIRPIDIFNFLVISLAKNSFQCQLQYGVVLLTGQINVGR